MEISEFTLKLILLLIPGAVASLIFVKLTTHTKWTSFKFLSHSVLFGSFSYIIATVIFGNDISFQSFWKNLTVKDIPFNVILRASFISIIIGLSSAALDTYKIINRIGIWLKSVISLVILPHSYYF